MAEATLALEAFTDSAYIFVYGIWWHSFERLELRFPSELELLLWRIAAFSIMAGFPAFILSSYLLLRIRQSSRRRHKKIARLTGKLIGCFFYAVSLSIIVLYSLSRVYLVVESFISLCHVPIGVYAAIP